MNFACCVRVSHHLAIAGINLFARAKVVPILVGL